MTCERLDGMFGVVGWWVRRIAEMLLLYTKGIESVGLIFSNYKHHGYTWANKDRWLVDRRQMSEVRRYTKEYLNNYSVVSFFSD